MLGLAPVRIPVRAAVVGSPIRLHDATLGLSNITEPPTLAWAPVPAGAPPQKKACRCCSATARPSLTHTHTVPMTQTIRVLNRGPKPAQLQWRLLDAADPERPLAATSAVSADGRIVLGLGVVPCAPLTVDTFRISPLADVLPPGGERHFTVRPSTLL